MADASDIVAPFFEPLALRSLQLRNRIAMAPMTRYFSPGHEPGDNVVEYYRKRAVGGVGLIITEGVGIDEDQSVDDPALPVLRGDGRIAAWRRVTDAVHGEGGAIVAQLWHQGALRDPKRSERPDLPGLRPSGYWGTAGLVSVPQDYIDWASAPTDAITEEQIADVIASYAAAAANAIAAGFDGVEIHGAHGYLIDTFFWRDTNRRTDRWGGEPLARARFGVEVVRAVRAAIGEERPILFRFSQHKQQDYNARFAETPEELGVILGALSDAGADLFHSSVRRFNLPAFDGSNLNLAGWARKLTGKPSMTVGGIGLNNWMQETLGRIGDKTETLAVNNLAEVRELFDQGMFDMFAVGRALINDPNWVKRVRSGEDFLPYDRRTLHNLV